MDTFDTLYADRYAEQLWDTMFAKTPEITLFSWGQLASTAPAIAGDRPWADDPTSFDWKAPSADSKIPTAGGHAGRARLGARGGVFAVGGQRVSRQAGVSGRHRELQAVPVSSDEDFLQNYLGNIGIPIDLTPHFPKGAAVVLLTENAALDPNLVPKIKANLGRGGQVIITSGLLHALAHRGIGNVAEIRYSGLPIAAHHYYGTFGPHGGGDLDVPGRDNPPVIFPQIHFYTNDSWPLIRGEAAANSVPILLATGYGRGELLRPRCAGQHGRALRVAAAGAR